MGTPWQINMQTGDNGRRRNIHYLKIRSKQKSLKDGNEWKDSLTIRGRQYSLVQPLLQGRPWFGEMEGIRDEYITIIRLRFCHNLHRVHLKVQPFCDCDWISHVDQQHIILCYPKHKQQRENLYSAMLSPFSWHILPPHHKRTGWHGHF